MKRISIRPIGLIHNGMANADKTLKHGVAASIEVFPEFVAGLQGVERSTHIMVIGWLHRADRHILQVHRPRYVEADVKRGVFACRTPVRPNPLGVTTVRLVTVDGNVLYVDGLDMADGTPVLDIKPHAAGFDGVFSARSARDLSRLADPDALPALRSMLRDAENFHGELCAGLILGAKMVYAVMRTFAVAQKDPRVSVYVGANGCVADAVQALTGATFGNKRLNINSSSSFVFDLDHRVLRFLPRMETSATDRNHSLWVENLLAAEIAALCEVEEGTVRDLIGEPVGRST